MKKWIGRIAIGILAGVCLVLLCTLGSSVYGLHSAKAELNLMRAELSRIEPELASAQEELAITESELEIAEEELKTTREGLETTKEELAHLKISYDGLVTGHGYTIKDPTYNRMMSFIGEDKIDKKRYVEGKYTCSHFAMDVCNNAEEEGFRCAFTIILYAEGGHAIIAFNTIDEGLIYIEPQSDELVEPEIGKSYYQCVIPKPGSSREKPDYDDTIEEILVIW